MLQIYLSNDIYFMFVGDMVSNILMISIDDCNDVVGNSFNKGFYIAFNTVQVISRWLVLWAEETSTSVHAVGQGSVL